MNRGRFRVELGSVTVSNRLLELPIFRKNLPISSARWSKIPPTYDLFPSHGTRIKPGTRGLGTTHATLSGTNLPRTPIFGHFPEPVAENATDH